MCSYKHILLSRGCEAESKLAGDKNSVVRNHAVEKLRKQDQDGLLRTDMIHLFLMKEMGGSDGQTENSCAIVTSLDRAFVKHPPRLASFSPRICLVTVLDMIPLPLLFWATKFLHLRTKLHPHIIHTVLIKVFLPVLKSFHCQTLQK